ncbi:hypothetical protein Tco_0506883, partial [Tanacetum coccineum]
MPPDVLLHESRQPDVLRILETHVNGVFKVPKDPLNH